MAWTGYWLLVSDKLQAFSHLTLEMSKNVVSITNKFQLTIIKDKAFSYFEA